MDDRRLLRNYHDDWKSLLQDVCCVENFSRFMWARLAALEERRQQACSEAALSVLRMYEAGPW